MKTGDVRGAGKFFLLFSIQVTNKSQEPMPMFLPKFLEKVETQAKGS